MPVSLPQIDIPALTTLQQAKEALLILMNSFEKVMEQNENLQKENQKLREEIAHLKGQPKKPKFSASRNQQGASVTSFLSGKRVWNKRKKGKLPVDREVQLDEVEKCACGSGDFQVLRTFHKIVQGMIIARDNVCYRGREKQCVSCGKLYKSIIPEELKGVTFDPTLRSLLSFFKYGCRMTHPLISRMLSGFGISISKGAINDILLTNGRALSSAYQKLKKAGFAKSSYLQSDATGSKRRHKTGKVRNQHVQVISNKLISVFAITPRYNIKTLRRLLGTIGRTKPFVSDDASANGEGLWMDVKQLCWVHEIRHYRKLFPFFTRYREYRDKILSEWKTFYRLAKQYGRDPTEDRRKQIEHMFDTITSQTTGYELLDKQLRITRKKKSRLLTFLDHPYLPIHNNQCEQDLREFVIQRKISRETKSVLGDKSLARHLSVIQTAQKQGLDVFATLHGVLTGQLSPAILTANVS